MKHAEDFKDLEVYQVTRALSKDIYVQTLKFPREELYSMTDQIRRSSRSIGAQIAEAWAKRRYENYFINKLTDADGEQHETRHWIEEANDCGYISSERALMLLNKCHSIGRMINSMIDKSHLFCKNSRKR